MRENQGFHNARIFPGRRRNCVGEGSVSIAYIMQSFHKFIVSLLSNPTPYEGSTLQIIVEVGVKMNIYDLWQIII